jgi:glycosyltransferase involved in cell wall biosynthesis
LSTLSVLHVLRAPVGGLFRHVADLSREQARRGHRVGLIIDGSSEDARARVVLAELAPLLQLGVLRLPIARNPHPSDAANMLKVRRHILAQAPDVVHGHGSKGGLYARACTPASIGAARFYTPHGGSLNYKPGSVVSRVYMLIERLLSKHTDFVLFESAYARTIYEARVRKLPERLRVVVNGIAPAEFAPIAPAEDAADIVYVGELRTAKGVDTLIEAIGLTEERIGRPLTAVIVGEGPDRGMLQDMVAALGLDGRVTLPGAMPARDAFRLGRTLVTPSRAESLPYILLEAAAARIPLIATHVGGVPEIFGPHAGRLIPPDDPERLAQTLVAELAKTPETRAAEAAALEDFVRARVGVDEMVDAVIASYCEALRRRGRVTSKRR